MLLLGSALLHCPIMSLQTGTRLAETTRPIVDPSNLRIIAYEVEGPLLTDRPAFIRIQDVREYSRVGMIVDGNDELIGLDDVIAVKNLHDINFNIIGLNVIDERRRRIGKVADYTIDTDSFVIQQINVRRGIFKSLTDAGLLINRSQIIEINDTTIVVRSPTVKAASPVVSAVRGAYVNPFRAPKPQTEAPT